jgi:hypothetical protein
MLALAQKMKPSHFSANIDNSLTRNFFDSAIFVATLQIPGLIAKTWSERL